MTFQVKIAQGLKAVPAASWDLLTLGSGSGDADPGNPFVSHAFLSALEDSGCVGSKTGWAPVHVLVVPRQHIADAGQVGAEHGAVLAEMLTTAQEVARREGVRESGFRLVMNVGEDALNSVGHLHLHGIGGRRLGWPPG